MSASPIGAPKRAVSVARASPSGPVERVGVRGERGAGRLGRAEEGGAGVGVGVSGVGDHRWGSGMVRGGAGRAAEQEGRPITGPPR